MAAVCRGRWSLPGGGEGAPTSQYRPLGPGLRSRPCPDATRRSASVTRAAGRVVRREPEAAAGARSAVPPHGRWVSWGSGLGVQKTRRAAEAHMRCGLEARVQGRRCHRALLRSLCSGGRARAPRRALQAPLVGTAGPAPRGRPGPEPSGPVLAGPGDGSGHSANHQAQPAPGSAASLLSGSCRQACRKRGLRALS